jgi:hypothetical protein
MQSRRIRPGTASKLFGPTVRTEKGEQAMQIIELSAAEIRDIGAAITRDDVWQVLVAVDNGIFKIKINGGVWSPPMGKVMN